jgi:GntR family transcriptional regulator
MEASSQILELGYAACADDDAPALDVDPGATVAILERLRLADGIPMAIERAVLAPVCANVIDSIGTGSLHVAFEAMGLTPSKATAQVHARAASKREQQLLELEPDGVVLCERRVIFDLDATPLEHTETRYAADRYVFDVMMYRDQGGSAK